MRETTPFTVAWIAIFYLVTLPDLEAGSVSGEVRFHGVPPKLAPIKVTKDQEYCGQAMVNEAYIIGPNGGLKNGVVFIESPSTLPKGSPREHVLDNSGCRFVPHVMALVSGERLIIKNSDPKLHIVHSYLEQRTVFNLSLPFRTQRIDVTHRIKRPGILQVKCDTHGWMMGYIHVFDHPLFAITDEQGIFAIDRVPAGRYILKAWHEEAGIQSKEIIVGEKDEVRVIFEFTR